MGNLSVGRIGIIGFGVVYLRKSLAIAIRYSAIRKQFGPSNKELPVLEYPLQVRLSGDEEGRWEGRGNEVMEAGGECGSKARCEVMA